MIVRFEDLPEQRVEAASKPRRTLRLGAVSAPSRRLVSKQLDVQQR